MALATRVAWPFRAHGPAGAVLRRLRRGAERPGAIRVGPAWAEAASDCRSATMRTARTSGSAIAVGNGLPFAMDVLQLALRHMDRPGQGGSATRGGQNGSQSPSQFGSPIGDFGGPG